MHYVLLELILMKRTRLDPIDIHREIRWLGEFLIKLKFQVVELQL
jgi:hypothetical protein